MGRRDFLAKSAVAASAASFLTNSDAAPAVPKPANPSKTFQWKIVTINQRDYVRMKEVKTFYLFQRYERTGNHLWLRSQGLWVKVSADSDDLFINDIKFCMSLPAVEREGDLLISRMDLAKLVEPVLRPKLIAQPIVFDTVVIDAGHGGDDPGSPGILGWEKNYTLDLANRVKTLVEGKGLKTKMVRAGDQTIKEKEARTRVANAIPNSIFISLHFNSGHKSAAGIETYALSPHGAASTDHSSKSTDFYDYSGNDRDSENIALATAIHAMVLFKVKCFDRGIRRARWTVLTGLERPGILFEGGFLTNSTEAAQIDTSSYRDQLADAICQGILRYRNVLVSRRSRTPQR